MRKTKNNVVYCIIMLLVMGFSGCGYSTQSLISQLYKTIYIRAFVNKIDITSDTSVAKKYKVYQPLLENDITRKVIDQFVLDGNLRLAKEEDADLILEGELIDFRKHALRYTGEDDREIEEYRLNVVVNLRLHDTSDQTIIWQQDNFIGDTTYFTQGTLAKSESTAIDEAVADLAQRIVDGVIDIW